MRNEWIRFYLYIFCYYLIIGNWVCSTNITIICRKTKSHNQVVVAWVYIAIPNFCQNCVTVVCYSLSVAGASLGVISIWYHLYSGFIIAPVAASIPQPSTSQRLMIDTGLNFLSITMISV